MQKGRAARLDLGGLRRRLGMTQVQLSRRIRTDQSGLSKLERSSDLRLSSLRRYVHALGAVLEITALTRAGDRHVLLLDARDRGRST